jgi:hypothetical protein
MHELLKMSESWRVPATSESKLGILCMDFFNDPDQNLYSFAISELLSNGTIRVKIDDSFLFDIFQDFTVASHDDFLVDFCKTVNSTKYIDLTALLISCNLAYEALMGIENTPEEILELDAEDNRDNDINDIKFVDRMRFREGDFNSDLFFNAFDYCEVRDVLRFGRVSKAWYVLANNDTLWKGICSRVNLLENPNGDPWKSIYVRNWNPFRWVVSTSKDLMTPLIVDEKMVTSPKLNGQWLSARTNIGCKVGEKMSFGVVIHTSDRRSSYFTFGVIDQSWDVDDRLGKHSYAPGCGVIVVSTDVGSIFGVEIDRTQSTMQTVRCWKDSMLMTMSQMSLNKDHVWFPCVSMAYENSCSIAPGWK